MSTTPAGRCGRATGDPRGGNRLRIVETSRIGRALISAFIIFTLGGDDRSSNLPASELRRTA